MSTHDTHALPASSGNPNHPAAAGGAPKDASRLTEDEIHARDWWCPHCKVDVPPEMVTKDGEHYLESGGCGQAVRGQLKDADGVQPTEGGQRNG